MQWNFHQSAWKMKHLIKQTTTMDVNQRQYPFAMNRGTMVKKQTYNKKTLQQREKANISARFSSTIVKDKTLEFLCNPHCITAARTLKQNQFCNTIACYSLMAANYHSTLTTNANTS
jgi:DeoR/GlpR family transcriptional regulator of sugar metabolism